MPCDLKILIRIDTNEDKTTFLSHKKYTQQSLVAQNTKKLWVKYLFSITLIRIESNFG